MRLRIAAAVAGIFTLACGVSSGEGPQSRLDLCRSEDFRNAFVAGQDEASDDASPSPALVAYGNSAMPCLQGIAERGGDEFGIHGCLEGTVNCRTWALRALKAIGTLEARSYLVTYLRLATSPALRIAAIHAVGNAREVGGRGTLLGLTNNADPEVVAAAIVALGAIGDRSDFNAMYRAAVGLPDDAFFSSIQGFRLLGDPRGFRDLRARVDAIKSPDTRRVAKHLLEEAIAALEDDARVLTTLRSGKGQEVYEAIRASTSKSTETHAALMELLRSDDQLARAESVVALGRMRQAADFEVLLDATLNLSELYAPIAARGLEWLNDPRAIAPLEQYAATIIDPSRRNVLQGVIERLRRSSRADKRRATS